MGVIGDTGRKLFNSSAISLPAPRSYGVPIMSIRPLFSQQDPFSAKRDDRIQADPQVPSRGAGAKVASVSAERGTTAWMMWVVLLAIAFLALLVSRVSAQQPNFQYDSIPMHPKLNDEAVVKSVEAQAKSFATTGSGNPNMANGYFTAYVPAKMTAPDGVKYISDLAKETTTMLARAQRSNKPQVAAQLTKYVYDGMNKVAVGNYHPAARINAILILSKLDRQPANPATRSPPIPLPQTLPILMSLYEDETNVDGVRAAALQGIHRQVTFGFPQISPDDRAKIAGMMTSLLESPAPEGRPTDAHAYLQRYAVDVLDVLRGKGDKSLGTKLISISTEPNNPDLIALYSASRLAAMGPELQGQVQQPKKVLDSWSKRVLDAFESELARLDALERPAADRTQPVKPETLLEKKTTETAARAMSSGSMMDMDMGYDMSDMMGDYDEMDMGMGMDMDMMSMQMQMMMPGARPQEKPQPPEVIASRQKLNNVLQQIHLGVTGKPTAGVPSRSPGGILASVAPDQKQVVEDWVAEMEAVVTALNDRTLDDRKKYKEGLVAQIEVLRDIAGVEQVDSGGGAELPDEFAPVDPLGELAPAPAAAAVPAANEIENSLVSP